MKKIHFEYISQWSFYASVVCMQIIQEGAVIWLHRLDLIMPDIDDNIQQPPFPISFKN